VLVTRKTGMRGVYPARDIFRVNLAGGLSTRLTKDGVSLDGVAGPDRIAFSRVLQDEPDGPVTAVWTMAPDGSDARRLVRAAGASSGVIPSRWSASGTRLLGIRPSFVSSVPVAIDPRTGTTRNLRPRSTGYDLTMDLDASGDRVLALLRSADTTNGRLVALDYRTGRVVRVYAPKASSATWVGR
jgi:Tol biopolymer transport system component